MDPPAMMNDGSFNFGQIWQFPMNGSGRDRFGQGLDQFLDSNREFEVNLEQRVNHGAKKRRDLQDDSGNGVSTRSFHGNGKNDSSEKRAKTTGSKGENQNSKAEAEPSSGKHVEESNRPPEVPKQDYIHVRARRGQATDSHSLAERARREKISERMKILQDLVPGCNKVIGKALVLDEIINYIQSLQHQIGFLSMKLEAVNSKTNPVLEVFPSKEFGQEVFDASMMMYGPQSARECNRGLSPEWLHMQVGGGEGGFERAS